VCVYACVSELSGCVCVCVFVGVICDGMFICWLGSMWKYKELHMDLTYISIYVCCVLNSI